MPPEHSDPAPESDEDKKDESEKGPPSRGKVGWAVCVLALLLLTIATTTWLQSMSPGEPLSKGAYVVVAAFWGVVVLPIYLWITRKKK